MNVPWYFFAIASAASWGVHYPLVGLALTRMTPLAALMLAELPGIVLLPFCLGSIVEGVRGAVQSSWQEATLLVALPVTNLLGHGLILRCIGAKGAPLASLIEVSYPLFVLGFTYLFFRRVDLNAGVGFGGALVIIGVVVIIACHPD